MPTGDVLRYIRIIGAWIPIPVWLAWIVCKILRHDSADHIYGVVSSLPLILMVTNLIAPLDLRGTRPFTVLLFAVTIAWLTGVWRYGPPATLKIVLVAIAGVFGLCVLAWIFGDGYRRWKAIASPVTRIFIGTAVITAAAILIGGAAFYGLAMLAGSAPGAQGNWMVTALILYLPVMGLIGLGFYLRRTRNVKHDE